MKRRALTEDEHRGGFTFQVVLHGSPSVAADVNTGRRAEEPEVRGQKQTRFQEKRTCEKLHGRRAHLFSLP